MALDANALSGLATQMGQAQGTLAGSQLMTQLLPLMLRSQYDQGMLGYHDAMLANSQDRTALLAQNYANQQGNAQTKNNLSMIELSIRNDNADIQKLQGYIAAATHALATTVGLTQQQKDYLTSEIKGWKGNISDLQGKLNMAYTIYSNMGGDPMMLALTDGGGDTNGVTTPPGYDPTTGNIDTSQIPGGQTKQQTAQSNDSRRLTDLAYAGGGLTLGSILGRIGTNRAIAKALKEAGITPGAKPEMAPGAAPGAPPGVPGAPSAPPGGGAAGVGATTPPPQGASGTPGAPEAPPAAETPPAAGAPGISFEAPEDVPPPDAMENIAMDLLRRTGWRGNPVMTPQNPMPRNIPTAAPEGGTVTPLIRPMAAPANLEEGLATMPDETLQALLHIMQSYQHPSGAPFIRPKVTRLPGSGPEAPVAPPKAIPTPDGAAATPAEAAVSRSRILKLSPAAEPRGLPGPVEDVLAAIRKGSFPNILSTARSAVGNLVDEAGHAIPSRVDAHSFGVGYNPAFDQGLINYGTSHLNQDMTPRHRAVDQMMIDMGHNDLNTPPIGVQAINYGIQHLPQAAQAVGSTAHDLATHALKFFRGLGRVL